MAKLLEKELLLKECQATLARYGVNFSIEEVTSKSREAEDVFVRALIAFILKARGYNLVQIGKVLGRAAHGTVINALKYSEGEKQGRWRYLKTYNHITAHLQLEISGKSVDEMIKFHEAEHKRLLEFKKKIINSKKMKK